MAPNKPNFHHVIKCGRFIINYFGKKLIQKWPSDIPAYIMYEIKRAEPFGWTVEYHPGYITDKDRCKITEDEIMQWPSRPSFRDMITMQDCFCITGNECQIHAKLAAL